MIEYEKIEQTPLQAALGLYQFVRTDLAEGLNYGVSVDAYNGAMAGIGSERRTDRGVTAREFEADFRAEYNARRPHAQAPS